MTRPKLIDLIGQFTTLPNAFIESTADISTSAKWLFVVLRYRTNSSSGVAWPAYDKLCRLTGFNRNTLSRAIKELIEAGWIETHRRFGQSTVYALTITSKKKDATSSTETDTNGNPPSSIETDTISSIGLDTLSTLIYQDLKDIGDANAPPSEGADNMTVTATATPEVGSMSVSAAPEPEQQPQPEPLKKSEERRERADRVLLAWASRDDSEKRIARARAGEGAKALMSQFHQDSGLPYTASWPSAANEMDGLGVKPEDVTDAWNHLKAAGMMLTDLHSVRKVAIALSAERKKQPILPAREVVELADGSYAVREIR